MERDVFNQQQAAKRVGVSRQTWARWVRDGEAPPPDKVVGKRVLWWFSETLDKWMQTRS
jgi:predicted DNA-binding transcriptional regulator AlpA